MAGRGLSDSVSASTRAARSVLAKTRPTSARPELIMILSSVSAYSNAAGSIGTSRVKSEKTVLHPWRPKNSEES
jgi:hypothetical protein